MFVIPSELERETASLEAYAAQYSMAVALANFGGPSGGLAAGGRSAIWSDTGELLAQLDAIGTGVGVAIEGSAGWRARALRVEA
jgi:predicted amidohydrolase